MESFMHKYRAKMSIDPKLVELTADVLKIFQQNIGIGHTLPHARNGAWPKRLLRTSQYTRRPPTHPFHQQQ